MGRAADIAARILAVVLPVLVFAGSYRALLAYHDEEDANAARNAGRVFNARVIDGGAAEAMDQLLAEQEPEVIVLGPSYANTDIDPVRLATRMGLAKDAVALLSVPNSIGAHWYAILKYRVFDAGYRPKLIVVVSGLQSMLLTSPLTESSYVNLEVQLPEGGDPLVTEKVAHDFGLTWARVREQRGKVRAAWFDWLRDGPILAVSGYDEGRIRGALARVFADDRIDMRLHGSSIPVVEGNRGPERVYDPAMLPGPEQGFLGDVTRLANEHGAQVVWIRPPMSPFIPKELADVVLPGVQDRAQQVVAEQGGTLLDLRRIRMTVDLFRNEDHMNEEGSRLFTEHVADALLAVDALYPPPGPQGLPPLRSSAAPDPTVPPGTTASWTFDGWTPIRGTFAALVLVSGAALDGVSVEVAGRNVWVRPEGVARKWGHAALDGAPTPAGPFTVRVTVPAGLEPVRVEALVLGRGARRTFVVGDSAALDGPALEVVGAAVRADARDPVRVPGWDREVIDLPGPVGGYDTEKWAFLSDDALLIETDRRCSPFRITEDGRPLAEPNVPCSAVPEGPGRMCHDGEQIRFSAADGTDPARNGRPYRIVLAPDRRCGDLQWLFPVDRSTWRAGADALAALPDGARWLTLDASYLNHRDSALAVRVRVDGRTALDTGFDARELKQGPKRWRLEPPIPPDAQQVEIELESSGFVFFLIRGVTLSERMTGERRVRAAVTPPGDQR